MFRTATGQTGKDAYIYELAQIINHHRELKARLARLGEAIDAEVPANSRSYVQDGSFTVPYSLPWLARHSGLNDDDLDLLKRAINAYEPPSNHRYADFPGLSIEAKIAAMVESGLAEDAEDALMQLVDMGEAEEQDQ